MKTFACLLSAFLVFPQLAFCFEVKLEPLPGLEVTEYPRHPSQSDDDKIYLAPERFGDPIGKVRVATSLAPWQWESERNAIARGVLVIEKDGDYAFSTDSFYDRNLLMIGAKVVCGFVDGSSRIVTVPLKKGNVEIVSVGYVGSRGSAQVRWRPPGQRELSGIPAKHLKHLGIRVPKARNPKPGPEAALQAKSITIVTKDFVVDVYKNGKKIPETKRKLLLDRFGATAERVEVTVREGDWLVFHVANNRLRHKGTKYFAIAGALDDNPFSIVSDPDSEQWSVCDDPAKVQAFIRERDAGTRKRALQIEKPWEEGLKFMRQYAGDEFFGKPLWGASPSTWIKYVALGGGKAPKIESPSIDERRFIIIDDLVATDPSSAGGGEVVLTPAVAKAEPLSILKPKRWPVQILSAIYGTGGKNANVTERVKQLVEEDRAFFAANPGHLKADPNPYWNKSLHIVYMKDGVRREQRRNENEHILPESFYGPHDAAELTKWLAGTRWSGPKGELQFHASGALTGPGLARAADWEAFEKNWVRITWAEDEKKEFAFDYWWRSFGDPKDGKNAYRIVK